MGRVHTDVMDNSVMVDRFPFYLFAVYVFYYSGQSIYNTYLNLYLNSIGLSQSRIGLIISVSTIFILVGQIFWGIVSDKSSSKNHVLSFLLIMIAALSLAFYLNESFAFLMAVIALFSLFFNPVIPLLDNFTLELLEGSNHDYGHIRMGGTVGYCLTVLSIGFFLADEYRKLFYIVAICMIVSFFFTLRMPTIHGYGKRGGRNSFKQLLSNRPLLVLIAFNLSFSLGMNFFYNFYPIYFLSIGGDSAKIGLMMFICAVTEIPVLLVIKRMVDKIGLRGVLMIAGMSTALRWFLLYEIQDPNMAIAVNALHGIGYTGFSYSLITFIGKTVPREMRAIGQTMNAMIGIVGSKVVFGYVGGIASELFGADTIMLYSSVLVFVATSMFLLWSKNKKTFGMSVQ
nr:MFS transporter [uncultured Sphaerochaeta sp.]